MNVPIEDLYEAYFACRRNKRRSAAAVEFELRYEDYLSELCRELNDGSYRPGPMRAFIVRNPVLREVFAPQFRDRVVHHYLMRRLLQAFEAELINDTYSCRVGKGTLYGLQRLQEQALACAKANPHRRVYVLKLDIQAFFMSIDRQRLFLLVSQAIDRHYHEADADFLRHLCQLIIFSDPTDGCSRHSPPALWRQLPADKSLFGQAPGRGLPIGNLTSQVFANIYLNPLDRFVLAQPGVQGYGRYVDDFYIISTDHRLLRRLIPKLRKFLRRELGLRLHPHKVYLQPYSHGVPFVGGVAKGQRLYIGNRTKGNAHAAICRHNANLRAAQCQQKEPNWRAFLASVNSYFGLIVHFRAWRIRRHLIRLIDHDWWRYVHSSRGYLRPGRK